MQKDIDVIKQKYNIKDLADLTGISYKIERNGDLLIKSPANPAQKTESLRVRANYKGSYNYFKDFYSGQKGDILNFTEFYFNKSTKEAVELLKDVFNEKNLNVINEVKEKNSQFIKQINNNSNKNIEIVKAQELQNRALIDYLQKRGIGLEIAQKANIKEIYYKIKNKNYFAVAFKNDKEGYEVRNQYFKGSFGEKDITVLKNNNSKEVNVFEGFMDYAAAINLSKGKVLEQNNIILNSISLADRAIQHIKANQDLERVKLYLDNDEAGKAAASKIKEELSKEKEIFDMSIYYVNFKDLNDFLNDKQLKREQQLER